MQGKQAKIFSPAQEKAILGYGATTRYPARDRVMFLLSIKAGLRAKEIASLTWVSGSSRSKTYGKGAAVRDREENRTLPRRNFFGKDTDGRSRIFKELQVLLSPIEAVFSGKLSYTSLTGRRRASP